MTGGDLITALNEVFSLQEELAIFVTGVHLVKRTSEFDARTKPEQTWILDRTVTLGKLLAL